MAPLIHRAAIISQSINHVWLGLAGPLPSSGHHLSNDDCLDDKRETYQNCSVLCCVWQLCTMICTHIWAIRTVDCWFLGVSLVFSERERTWVYVHVRCMLSPVHLSSVTLVRPTQVVQIFGNISTAFGTLAIRWHPHKILRRSSQGNPSVGGVKHEGYKISIAISDLSTSISRKRCKIGGKLVLITNRKS